MRERLGEHHREALEERRLRERERTRERVVADVVVDEAGDDDVVAYRESSISGSPSITSRIGSARGAGRLYATKKSSELARALAFVDAARVEQVRRVAEPVRGAEHAPDRPVPTLDADADDGAGRRRSGTGVE